MDEESGLDRLVALRKTRPTFARMISWEIDNSGASRRRTKKMSATDEYDEEDDDCGNDSREDNSEDGPRGDNSESDDSEYFSAGEEIDESCSEDMSDLSLSHSSFTQQSDITSDTFSTATDETDGMANSLNLDVLETDTKLQSNYFEKKRTLSKKQKKKRRDKWKYSLYADYEVPFRNVEDIDIDVGDFIGFTDENSGACLRNVPSLLQLCLQTISSKKHNAPRLSTQELPDPMKKVLFQSLKDQSFVSMQLSWLYRLIAHVEEDIRFHLHEGRDSKKRLLLKGRNIWSYYYYDFDGNEQYIGKSCSSFLPYSYLNIPNSRQPDFRSGINTYGALGVMAAILDLMLPRQLSAGRLRHASRDCSTESELIRKTTDSLVYSVREILKKRYPDAVHYFFDRAVPYAFWARGNVRFAGEWFVRLAQAEEGPREKAMWLSEAARMYANSQDIDRAKRFYLEASGAVSTTANVQNQQEEVSLQQFMLLAALHDQGIMTEKKTAIAAGSWAAVIKYFDASSPWSSVLCAVESFLCFHSGSTQGGVKDHLQEAASLIEGLLPHCDLLLLYLSFVKALLGEDLDAKRAFKAFDRSVHSMLVEYGAEESGSVYHRHHPWGSLTEHHKHHGVPHLLQVVWRTRLGHPRVVNNTLSYEGDLQSDDLSLRFNEHGNLTADIQLVLPPVRALNMDPYTGTNITSSSETQTWKSSTFQEFYEEYGDSGRYQILPTLCELFRDKGGNSISLLSPESSLLTHEVTIIPQITAFWSGADGKKAKLNLTPLLMDADLEVLFDTITREQKRLDPSVSRKTGTRGSREWVEDTKMVGKFLRKKGLQMTLYGADRVLNNVMDRVRQSMEESTSTSRTKKEKKIDKEREKKEARRQKKNQSSKKITSNSRTWKTYLPSKLGFILDEFHVYEDTLFLVFKDNSTDQQRIYVFLGCTSKEDFLNPVVTSKFCLKQFRGEASYSHEQEKAPFVYKSRTPQVKTDSIVWHSGGRPDRNLTVFGKKGECLKTRPFQEGIKKPFVLGSKVYGIEEEKWVSCDNLENGDEDDLLSEELPPIQYLLKGGGKLIVVTESATYFLDPDSLSVLPVKMNSHSSRIELGETGCIKHVQGSKVRLLEERERGEKTRLALGVNSLLLLVDIVGNNIEIVQHTQVVGQAMEVYTVSEQVGYLVTTTVHKRKETFYREHLFYYRYDLKLLGVLPFLGPGPRSFCVKYLPGTPESSDTEGAGTSGGSHVGGKGWHVFIRDGHEGIMGIRLP